MNRFSLSTRMLSLLVALALVVVACAGSSGDGSLTPTADGSPTPTAEGSPMPALDLEALPRVEEATLAGLVDAELEVRGLLRESSGLAESLGEDGDGFLERFDADHAAYGLATLQALADEADIGPLAGAASGLTAGLGMVGPATPLEWRGSLQAVSGNFTMSMFLGLVVQEWQRLSDSNWTAQGQLSSEVHDRVVDGVAEHSEMRTTVNGSANGDELRFEIHVVSTSTLTVVSSGEVIGTYNATGRGVIVAKGCPDPDGVAAGRYTLELAEEGSGLSGTVAGGNSVIDGPFSLFNGDDARLIKTDFVGSFDSGGHGTLQTGEPFQWGVASTMPMSIPARGTLEIDVSRGTYQETGAVDARSERATATLLVMAGNFLSGVAQEAERFWRSGRCIDLTTSVESHKVDPSEEVSFDVTSRHHFDQAEVEAPIVATFSGIGSIDPASGTEVPYPATFTVTAGSEEGDKATIALEQTSKRGIGKKKLEFEVAIQDLRLSLDGTYTLSAPRAQINVHFVITDMALTRGEDGVYRGSGTGTIVGGSVLSGNCTASVDSPVPLEVEGRLNESDPELIRIVFPIESIGGQGTEMCAGQTFQVPAAAAIGPIVATAGQREVRIGETVTLAGGGVQATITVVPAP